MVQNECFLKPTVEHFMSKFIWVGRGGTIFADIGDLVHMGWGGENQKSQWKYYLD